MENVPNVYSLVLIVLLLMYVFLVYMVLEMVVNVLVPIDSFLKAKIPFVRNV